MRYMRDQHQQELYNLPTRTPWYKSDTAEAVFFLVVMGVTLWGVHLLGS